MIAETRQDRFLFAMPLAVILVLFLIWPAAFGFLASFTDYAPTQLRTHFVGLDNYADVVGDSEFGATAKNILTFGLVSVSAELVVGFLIAYSLRKPFRGRGLLRLVLLIPWLISPTANGVMWHFMYASERGLFSFFFAWLGSPGLPSPLGMPDLALAAAIVTDIWRQAPFVSFLLLPGMISIPPEQWEHAQLEGASALVQIREIALPWLRPLVLTIALLLIGSSLGTFDSILVMTGGGPGSRTLLPGLYSYQRAFTQHNWPVGATSAWFIVVALVLVGLAYLRLSREQSQNGPAPRRIGERKPHPDFRTALPFPSPSFRFGPTSWKTQRQAGAIGRALLLGLIVTAFLLPLLWTVLASFDIKPENAVSPPRWQVSLSLSNYQEVGATEPGFLQELLTSTNLAVATTLLTIGIAFLAAYSLARSRWRAKRLLVQGFLILASLPVMAYAIPLGATVRGFHLYDTFVGVVLAETAVFSPLAVYILFGYITQVSPELEEAACLDGAAPLQLVWWVVLPAVATGVAATAIIIFVLSWNEFLVPFVLSTDSVRSIPMAMVDVFKWDRELEWSAVAAALVASLLPLLLLVAAAHRLLEYFSLAPTHPAN